MKLKVVKKFKEAQRPLHDYELEGLERMILEEGEVREAILVRESDNAIVDGHNRYDIAIKHDIPFSIRTMEFPDDDDVVVEWIQRNQRSRRNLEPHEAKLELGRQYNEAKKAPGRTPEAGIDQSAQNEHIDSAGSTAKKLGEATGRSAASVRRAAIRAEAYDSCVKVVQTLIDEKPSRATDKAVLDLAKRPKKEQAEIAKLVRSGEQETFADAIKAADRASDPDGEFKILRKKAEKTFGALLRAIDDMHETKRIPRRKKQFDALMEQLEPIISGWGS